MELFVHISFNNNVVCMHFEEYNFVTSNLFREYTKCTK